MGGSLGFHQLGDLVWFLCCRITVRIRVRGKVRVRVKATVRGKVRVRVRATVRCLIPPVQGITEDVRHCAALRTCAATE